MDASDARSAEHRLQERITRQVMPRLVRELAAQRDEAVADASRDALLLVYQILAVLHAEARGLLPVAKPGYQAIGPDWRGQQRTSKTIRSRLRRAFRIMKVGDGSLGMPPYPGELFSSHVECRLSDHALAETLTALTHDQNGKPGSSESLDYAALDVRHLGSIYEALLKAPLTPDCSHPPARKARGAYYTPAPIIEHIITHALGPVLDQHFDQLRSLFRAATRNDAGVVERFFDLRILDPAVGAGFFLLAAVDDVASRMAVFLRDFPRNPVSRALRRSGARQKRVTTFHLLRQRLLASCIHGVDIDPPVLEVARLSLYLQCSLPGQPVPMVQFQCGNTLRAAMLAGSPGFDVILGNPPYGAALDAGTLAAARKELPLLTSNADTAVGFLERALQLVRPGGRVGFILPKPLLYSFAWRQVRAALRGRIHHLADVSRAWQDVRLEQVILIASPQPTTAASYSVATLDESGFQPTNAIPWTWADRFQTLPCALDAEERALLDSLRLSPTTIGQLCKTGRGLPAQRELRRCGLLAVVGGRDLARWQVRSYSGYLAADPHRLAAFRGPKLLFQNIIAHIRRPRPHIQLTGAFDRDGIVTLDTVNNLVAREPGVDLWGILALLHSDLINWFVHAVVYSKAIRTMHFDQYFLDKIPLPPDWGKLLAQLAPLARKATRLVGKEGPRMIGRSNAVLKQMNHLVNEIYGVRKPVW